MLTIGRVCVKTCGRDAGKTCVIIDVLDNNFVMIDGATRRRKCNILHLEPLNKELNLKKGASHEDVVNAFKELGIEARNTKPKQAKPRPRKSKKVKVKAPVKDKKVKVEKKVLEKKETPKEEKPLTA